MLLVPLAERLTRKALTSRGVQSRYVKTSVAEHHLYDAPAARSAQGELLPTIVLLHGISSSAAVFAKTIARLRKHARRVLAVEAPGHGLSGPPNVALSPEVLFETMAEVLKRELTEPAIVCGNSLGGAIAVSFGLRHPELTAGLFLTSPAGARMDHDTFKGFLEVFDFRSNDEARAFVRRLYHRPPWYAPLVGNEVRSMFARKAVRDILDSAAAEHLFSPAELASLRMPIHLLWGKSDRLLPRENFEFYRRSLPPHTIVDEPDEIGHCPHFDDPDGYAERIVAFARAAAASAG
jgi:pimeloyl-ACP methyl ester carboxylesterase